MKEVRAKLESGMTVINSKEIQNILEESHYFEAVEDISHRVYDPQILVYHVKLDRSMIDGEVEEYSLDEDEYTAALLEQGEYFIDASMDEIKDLIEMRYHIVSVESAYTVQPIGGEIYFDLTLSFGDVEHGSLYKIASHVADTSNHFYKGRLH